MTADVIDRPAPTPVGSGSLQPMPTSILNLLRDRKRVVLVTCHADRSWTSQPNASIRSAGRRFATGNVVVVDWDTHAARHPRILYGDGIHPSPGAGSRAYARLIQTAISQ